MSDEALLDVRVETNDAAARIRILAIDDLVREKLRALLPKLGRELSQTAKGLAPVGRTKRLRDSIRAKFLETESGFMERVGPPIFYGRFIEFGIPEKMVYYRPATDRRRSRSSGKYIKGRVRVGYWKRFHVPAHPFMRPAVEMMREKIVNAVELATADAAQEVG